MVMNGRLDGHIVQGHVDCTAICDELRKVDGSTYFRFDYNVAPEMARRGYVTVEKGSVTVNGVSLTVCNSQIDSFEVAIIPYTMEHTNFCRIKKGTRVNLRIRHNRQIPKPTDGSKRQLTDCDMTTHKGIAVYCASSDRLAKAYYDCAREVGRQLALRGVPVINGGGRMGLMAATTEGAIEAGGTSIGVLPSFMLDRGWNHPALTETIRTADMHERKHTHGPHVARSNRTAWRYPAHLRRCSK